MGGIFNVLYIFFKLLFVSLVVLGDIRFIFLRFFEE